MVSIENPIAGQPAKLSHAEARERIRNGEAVATIQVNDQILAIRLVPILLDSLLSSTTKGYDDVHRSFHREAPRLPLVQADKMIRQEKSERNWSYAAGVKRTMRRDHTAEEAAAMRANA